MCKTCSVPLVDESTNFLQLHEISSVCRYCKEELTEDSDYCPHCGYLFNEHLVITCGIHNDRAAIGVCVVCEKPLCSMCANAVSGRLLCADHSEVQIIGEWAGVFESLNQVDVELAKGLLEKEGVQCQTYTQSDVPLAIFSSLISPQWKTYSHHGAYLLKLFVPLPELERAGKVLQDNHLIFKYECNSCGCRFNDENVVMCPQCREEFV